MTQRVPHSSSNSHASGRTFTRRQFLSTAAIAGAGITLGLRHRAVASTAANSKLNVGFIGVANRAGEDLKEVARETDLVNVAALCDVDEKFLAEAAAQHPSAKTFTDFRKMIDMKEIDAVVVGTPDHFHAVASMAALKSGRHVYCEKPLTHTVSEARAITETAHKLKRATQLGTQIHSLDNYRRVVELVQTGAIGPIREVHVWSGARYGGMDKPTDTPPIPAGFHWDAWLGPVEARPYHPEYAPFKWRNWWAFGGGTLADFGCHFMDLPYWALDLKYPTRVEVVDGPPVHPESTPVWLIVRYAFPERKAIRDGSTLPGLKLTWYHGGKQPSILTEEQATYFKSGVYFVGEKGCLLADYTRRSLLPEKDFASFKPPTPYIPKSIGHHKEWIMACKDGTPTTCNFDYSGPLTETALLGNAAYRAGCSFDWDAKHLKPIGCATAEQYIQHHYRKGWKL